MASRSKKKKNLSIFAFTWNLTIRAEKTKEVHSPIFYNLTNMNNFMQSSIWKWRFRRRSRGILIK